MRQSPVGFNAGLSNEGGDPPGMVRGSEDRIGCPKAQKPIPDGRSEGDWVQPEGLETFNALQGKKAHGLAH